MRKPNGEYYSFEEWDEFLQGLTEEQLREAELETIEDLEILQRRMISDRIQRNLESYPSNLRIYELLSTQLGMLRDEKLRRSGNAS